MAVLPVPFAPMSVVMSVKLTVVDFSPKHRKLCRVMRSSFIGQPLCVIAQWYEFAVQLIDPHAGQSTVFRLPLKRKRRRSMILSKID